MCLKSSRLKLSILAFIGILPCNSTARSVGFVFSKAPAPTNRILRVLILTFELILTVVPSSNGNRSYYTPSSEALVELVCSPDLTILSISSITTIALLSISSLIKVSMSCRVNSYSWKYSYKNFLISFTLRCMTDSASLG